MTSHHSHGPAPSEAEPDLLSRLDQHAKLEQQVWSPHARLTAAQPEGAGFTAGRRHVVSLLHVCLRDGLEPHIHILCTCAWHTTSPHIARTCVHACVCTQETRSEALKPARSVSADEADGEGKPKKEGDEGSDGEADSDDGQEDGDERCLLQKKALPTPKSQDASAQHRRYHVVDSECHEGSWAEVYKNGLCSKDGT